RQSAGRGAEVPVRGPGWARRLRGSRLVDGSTAGCREGPARGDPHRSRPSPAGHPPVVRLVIEVAVTEPSGLAVPVTETGAPGLRPASPEVVTVAVGGTATVMVFPAKFVSVSRSALTAAMVPTAIGASPAVPPPSAPAPVV